MLISVSADFNKLANRSHTPTALSSPTQANDWHISVCVCWCFIKNCFVFVQSGMTGWVLVDGNWIRYFTLSFNQFPLSSNPVWLCENKNLKYCTLASTTVYVVFKTNKALRTLKSLASAKRFRNNFSFWEIVSETSYVSKLVSETIFCFEKRFRNAFLFRETFRKRFFYGSCSVNKSLDTLCMCRNRSVKSLPILQCTISNEPPGVVQTCFVAD